MRHAINIGTSEAPELVKLETHRDNAGQTVFYDRFGVKHSPKYLAKWTEEYKNSRGIHEVMEPSFDQTYDTKTGETFVMNGVKAEAVPTLQPIPLDTLKANALQKNIDDYETAVEAIKNGYPVSERDTWRKQEEQAKAYKADPNAVTPFLDKLTNGKKLKDPALTKDALADVILAKALIFEELAGDITAAMQNKRDAINEATTVQELKDAVK